MNAIGLDIGSVRTKIALDTGAASSWHEPSARTDAALLTAFANAGGTGAPARRLADFLRSVLDRPTTPRQAAIVVAVPDQWTESADGPWRTAPGNSPVGAVLLRVLTEDVGFASARLVPGTQCVAATDFPAAGCLLVCDVGAETVGAAVYSRDGDGTRLLDAEHASVAESGLRQALLGSSAGDAHVVALENERCARGRRAELVLARAAVAERYLGTPVYLAGAHGAALTADVVLAALRPLADLAARVVRRLLARVAEPLLPELLLTGGNAIGPVESAVVAATGGRIATARRLAPSAAAAGALRIATGAAVALDGYPHELGIAIRRIRNGLLESATIAVGETGATPTIVTVDIDETGPLPVLVRVRRTGPWRKTEGAQAVRLPAGRYRVSALGSRAGLGAVLLRPIDGGPDVVYPLGPAAGEIHEAGSTT
jgi:hypothetical protein